MKSNRSSIEAAIRRSAAPFFNGRLPGIKLTDGCKWLGRIWWPFRVNKIDGSMLAYTPVLVASNKWPAQQLKTNTGFYK